MTSYKLTYFDFRVLGEPIRLLLTFGGIKFDEVRIKMAEWPALKSQFPLEQLPVLDINNKRIHQSLAIGRYLAKQFKLNGRNEWENLQMDIAVQTVEDLRAKIIPIHFERDEERKEKLFKEYKEAVFPMYMEKLNQMSKENRGYLANSSLTWADLFFVGVMDLIQFFTKEDDILENYPNLRNVVKHVKSHPNLKNYFETRKDSPF